MKSLIRAAPFFLTANLWAAHGIIQTTDGKTFEGDIRVEEGAFVVGDTNAAEKVGLQKLALMRIQPPTEQPAPSLTQTQGLRGAYFTNENFTGSSITRIDPRSISTGGRTRRPTASARIILVSDGKGQSRRRHQKPSCS